MMGCMLTATEKQKKWIALVKGWIPHSRERCIHVLGGGKREGEGERENESKRERARDREIEIEIETEGYLDT